MTTIEEIEQFTFGLSVDEIVCLVKGKRHIAVNSLQPTEGVTLEEMILSYLLDGYTAFPF